MSHKSVLQPSLTIASDKKLPQECLTGGIQECLTGGILARGSKRVSQKSVLQRVSDTNVFRSALQEDLLVCPAEVSYKGVLQVLLQVREGKVSLAGARALSEYVAKCPTIDWLPNSFLQEHNIHFLSSGHRHPASGNWQPATSTRQLATGTRQLQTSSGPSASARHCFILLCAAHFHVSLICLLPYIVSLRKV